VSFFLKAQTYVGLSDNPSFAGAEPLDRVAEIIAFNIGRESPKNANFVYTARLTLGFAASGPNSEYLLELHKAVAEISPESRDVYLDELADRVTRLLSAETLKN
jgi:cation transport regulator ChaC